MGKLRLNKTMRKHLASFASENCEVALTAKVHAAYKKALPLVIADVVKKYPADDMAILGKYGMSQKDSCLRGFSPEGQHLAFNCATEEDAPIVPTGYCSSRNYAWATKTAKAIEEFNFLVGQEKEAIRTVLRDYKALIENYQYAEDLIEVWPAAQKPLQGFFNAANKNLPATLPQEAIERIRAMNIGAKAA